MDCYCGKTPKAVNDGEGDFFKEDPTVRHRVECECGAKTSWYRTEGVALNAWANKSWVNRRKAA